MSLSKQQLTKRTALRRALSIGASEIESHIRNGSEWLYCDDSGEEYGEADQCRMVEAVREVAARLRGQAARIRR